MLSCFFFEKFVWDFVNIVHKGGEVCLIVHVFNFCISVCIINQSEALVLQSLEGELDRIRHPAPYRGSIREDCTYHRTVKQFSVFAGHDAALWEQGIQNFDHHLHLTDGRCDVLLNTLLPVWEWAMRRAVHQEFLWRGVFELPGERYCSGFRVISRYPPFLPIVVKLTDMEQ